MKHTIEVVSIDDDRISILGKEYYTKEYLEEMMRREYQRGLHRGQLRYVPKEEYRTSFLYEGSCICSTVCLGCNHKGVKCKNL